MKAIGVDFHHVTRKIGNLAKPKVTIEIFSNSITIRAETTFRNLESKFVIGEEWNEETPDGRKTKTIYKWVRGKLVQIQRWDGKISTITRYVDGSGDVVVDSVMGDILCRRVYARA